MRTVELFTGAGGLALGLEGAGFVHDTVIERDRHSCETIRENMEHGFHAVKDWKLHEGDVRKFDYATIRGQIDLVAGGPPCQPFSIGGKHRAHADDRDMFPEMVRAVRSLQPRAILVENVKGLTRKTFLNYFSYIILQLSHPEVVRRPSEDWSQHRDRLERYHTKGSRSGLEYNVVPRLVNAADYGVPQKRERVFIVGFRSDLGIEWNFPSETHSEEALLIDQWVTGEYWERNRVPKRGRPTPPSKQRKRIESLAAGAQLSLTSKLPWITVREALRELPDPERSRNSSFLNHNFVPGARVYVGHTGSPLDQPAKTLKAGDHGVPGGENCLVRSDGSVRYFSVREAARLQTFPDGYILNGTWGETMRQLGNAVPVLLAQATAKQIESYLTTLQ